MICPSCQGENTQTIKMVLLSGSSTSKGNIVGVDSNGDVGVAGISAGSKTNLAASLDPGNAPTDSKAAGYWGCGGCATVFGVMALAAGGEAAAGGVGIFLVGVGVLIAGFVTADKRKKDLSAQTVRWNEKVKIAENGWICHRCGHSWLPE